MKHLNLIFAVLALCIHSLFPTYAFFDKDIRLLTMQDGLVDNTVACIYKDEDGFMWFGTNNGLSRYDGRTIKNFNPLEASFSVEEIVKLSGDYLGIVSASRLYCFNRKSECFIPTVSEQEIGRQQVVRLLPMDETSFWAISGTKLQLYQWEESKPQVESQRAVSIKLQKEFKLLFGKGESFSAFCFDKSGRLCLATNSGYLILFHPDSPDSYQSILLDDVRAVRVASIMYKDDVVWISTVSRGIIRYHLQTGQIDRITYDDTTAKNQLSHTDVYQVIPIDNNRYLAVTWSGYTLLIPDEGHPEKLTTEVYNNTYSQVHQNLETRMISTYYDPNGVLWIGTNGGGVMYSDLRSQFYNRFHQDRYNEICSITMDDECFVWLATYHKGIMRSTDAYDSGKKLQFAAVYSGPGDAGETVLCSFKDSQGNIWFGNRNGSLTNYDVKSRRFITHTLMVGGAASTSSIWALYKDSNGIIWIGTEQGLLLFDSESGTCQRLPLEEKLNKKESLSIRSVVQTEDGVVWLGTSNMGVCKVSVSPSGHLSAKVGYESRANPESRSVRSLLAASDGNLYVGYMDGFAILSPQQDLILEFYTTADGLCSNFIGCITEDGKGHIWLGSNSGISRYSRHQHLFYNYYIAGSNRSALYSNNTLFFGNNQSMTYFNPDRVDAYPLIERVLLTGLEVDNRPVEIGKKINNQIILNEGLSYTNEIVLNNDNRDFSLTFNKLSYSNEQQKYNYRLLPYQENWLISDDGEKASYTNLPEGDYVFEVKNIYPDGHTGVATSLNIKILPHWSRTIAFRLFILLLMIGGMAYLVRVVRLRQRRLEREMQMKHELLTVNLEREKEYQMRMERENFFTGVAHELRTPLTLILAPLQELMKQGNPLEHYYKKLQMMHKSATSLQTLVDHVLYVQKIEAGMVKLQLSESDLVQVIKEVAEPFREMAEIKSLRFEVHLPEERLLYWIDRVKIASAVQNLLSNSFKYTPSGGSILLTVSQTQKDGQGYCLIAVSDTGTGIPEDLQKHVFESFITGENVPEISTKIGVGLHIVKNTMDLHHGLVTLESIPGEGSTFVLYVPEGKEHFVKDTYDMAECRQNEANQDDELSDLFSSASADDVQEVAVKKSLLIIEDNDEVRGYICSLFAMKYTIYEAADGEVGVRMAKEKLPELIISDVMMPVKNGFACCREIRAHKETAHIPILMLTAKAEDVDVLSGSRSGADDYVMKPFNPEILKAKVDNLILQREQLKRIYTKALMLKQKLEEGEPEDAFLQQLVHVIEANLSNEVFNVKMLAMQLNMSQPTLYRKVKQRSDLSVIDMIRSIRISKAASLILENRYSIQEITEMVGYSDTRTLRKHFTEHFGVSPSKYNSG